MKTFKTILLLFAVAGIAGGIGWFAAKIDASPPVNGKSSDRKVLFYQSAMHPWIKSDKPGKCTICGMDLVPVYEGDKALDTSPDMVTLNSNSITVLRVQSEAVRRQPLTRTLRVAGVIDDNDAVHRRLSAYVDGRIEKLFVNFIGAEVVAGQPLAVFYSPTLFAAEREYLSLHQQARNAPAGAGAELKPLLAAAAFKLRRLGLSEAQVAALPQKPEGDSFTEILAPMTGTVLTREVYAGQYVKEGDRLFELADFSTMWFRFDGYERDLAWLRPGQSVEITTPSLPGKVFNAPIKFIDPNLNEATRSAKVRVELPNPLVGENGAQRRQFLHRLYAEGVVKTESVEVMCVPRSAVLSPGAQPIVYVDLGGGSFQQRKIKLGRIGDTLSEVLEGLADGERVVLNGNLLIDAQAQLNSSGAGAAHEHGAADAATAAQALQPALNEAELAAVLKYLRFASAVSEALSADDLTKFNELAATSHAAMTGLSEAIAQTESLKRVLSRLATSAHLTGAADLASARRSFYTMSLSVVELARLARGPEVPVRIFECPMTKDVFAGAPAKAQWLQFDATKRNPYMGKRMLDCGAEVP
jgi:Cu(I)/Ag(I) efflux system membrane fusion protein